jgi:hypothetical protein
MLMAQGSKRSLRDDILDKCASMLQKTRGEYQGMGLQALCSLVASSIKLPVPCDSPSIQKLLKGSIPNSMSSISSVPACGGLFQGTVILTSNLSCNGDGLIAGG